MAAEPATWVVDASMVFGWFAAVPGSDHAVRLLDGGPATVLLAPDSVLVELLHAGWKNLRLGAGTVEQVQVLPHRAAEPFSRLFPSSALLARAGHWREELDHPAVDCLYVALACSWIRKPPTRWSFVTGFASTCRLRLLRHWPMNP